MNLYLIGFILIQIACLAHGTCVLESDFGFILNCNFKKSGLFRVRNLGGVKAHFGLGFSVGDELGLPESIGNIEGDGRRRALNYKTGYPGNIGVLPASKQPPEQLPRKAVQRSAPMTVTGRSKSMPTKRLAGNPPPPPPQQQMSMRRPLMTEAASLPLGVPAFRPIPRTTEKPAPQRQNVVIQSNTAQVTYNNKVMEPTPFRAPQAVKFEESDRKNITYHSRIPPFQAMPEGVSRISTGNTIDIETNEYEYFEGEESLPKVDLMGHTLEELAVAANVSVTVIKNAIYMREQQLLAEQRAAQAAQLRAQFLRTSTTSTTTTVRPITAPFSTTASPPPTMAAHNAGAKVMNAPKEYYPVGYDKNFDDNFKSKVDLPATTFSCGSQKHFPGLYADMELGCMVFHVCALTDDGLIMKSFLCPESTLFDQTILKCNWWFYVECQNSKNVYDSNIPVSKSYQLMKSLTYFSNYNKKSNDTREGIDMEALKNTVVSTIEKEPET